MVNVLNRPPMFQSKNSGTGKPGVSALSVQDKFPLFSSEAFKEEKPQNFVIIKENSLVFEEVDVCLLYTSPSPRDGLLSRMPSSA